MDRMVASMSCVFRSALLAVRGDAPALLTVEVPDAAPGDGLLDEVLDGLLELMDSTLTWTID
jgi:hypothetical protein